MTYVSFAAVFVGIAAVVAAVATLRRHLDGLWWLTTGIGILVLLVLTVVFDSVMIQADLFRYDESSLLGLQLWHAPLEDLAWPVAAGLLLPSLRALLTPAETAR